MFLRLLGKTVVARSGWCRCLSQIALNPIKSRSTKIPIVSPDTSPMKLSVLKRAPKKKRIANDSNSVTSKLREEQMSNVNAVATADWYDLDRLKQRFGAISNLFQLVPISEQIDDVLCLQLRPTAATTASSSSEAFVFDDGAIVFWNMTSDHEKLILDQVDQVSDNLYPSDLINNEKELMNFTEVTTASTLNGDLIRLSRQEQILDKYAFSNALALSVKLGMWEAVLDAQIEFIAGLANRLKQGKDIKIEHGLMQRKSGELYSLKHAVHLSHDFLDTPDFYWSNSRLESLYKKVFNYLAIAKRTRVLNERLSFSLELISVIEGHHNEKKHVRLEWIIIILIGVEVFFNIIDHLDFFTPDFLPKHKKLHGD